MVTECYGRDYQTVSINCTKPMCLRSVSVSCDIGSEEEVEQAKQAVIIAWNTRAANARGDGDREPSAWLVVSERAGTVCAELTEIGADAAIAGVVKEYGDAYGKTSKVPLYATLTTTPESN